MNTHPLRTTALLAIVALSATACGSLRGERTTTEAPEISFVEDAEPVADEAPSEVDERPTIEVTPEDSGIGPFAFSATRFETGDAVSGVDLFNSGLVLMGFSLPSCPVCHTEAPKISEAALLNPDVTYVMVHSGVDDEEIGDFVDELADNMGKGELRIHDNAKWEPETWPKDSMGAGFHEAPRGALGHWVHVKDGKIARYKCIVPSTWNAGPRDQNGQPGAYEAALQDNHTLHDTQQPIEILRTIHSFDPCIACAVHVTDPDGEELIKVKVR